MDDFTTESEIPVILDCGANIGISVLNYLRRHPRASITAFEPDPVAARALRRNLSVNGDGDVRVVEAAVWTERGGPFSLKAPTAAGCCSVQMIRDGPLGSFLSGGVGSSLQVARISRISTHEVKTFSVGFGADGAYMDEADDARRIASFIGTDHRRVLVTGKDVRDRICHIASSLDQPSVDG